MDQKLVNPRAHKDWLSPHSFEWYAQIGKLTGKYSYPWNCTTPEPNVEALFAEEVCEMVQNKTVLDIGCGHGDFTIKWSPMVKKIVGLDITSHFIKTGRNSKLCNVSFVTSNTKDKLPFANGEFDCAYNRKGPTSAYRDLKRIMKKGGKILSLHPGDHLSPELTQLFHNLFDSLPKGTPVLDKIQDNLEKGMLTQANIETVASVTYIHEPIDIVKLCCFGQTPSVHEMVINESMPEIERIFYEHATENGLRTTGRAYIVRTTV